MYRNTQDDDALAAFKPRYKVVPQFIGQDMASAQHLVTPDANGHLPWLGGNHVFYGMRSAVADAAKKTERNDAQFVGQFDWTDGVGVPLLRKNVGLQFSNLEKDKTVFFWCMNNTPQTRRLGTISGNHWVVLVVEMPYVFSELHQMFFDGRPIRVEYFDPMGSSIRNDMREFVRTLILEQLPSIVVKENEAIMAQAQMETIEWTDWIDFAPLDADGTQIQRDGVQCGVWCIWYTHWRCLRRTSDTAQFWFPSPQNNLENQSSFRRLYFTDDASLSNNMYHPKRHREAAGASSEPINVDDG